MPKIECFAIDVTNARPAALAILMFGFAPAALSIDNCRVLVAAPFTGMPPVFTDAAGFARTPLPIPGNTRYAGLQLFGQWAVFDPSGPLRQGASLSDGLRMQLGN
jgi:hypothetical protein